MSQTVQTKLKDKVMLITGASRGLGRDMCVYFSKLGLKIAVTARSTKKLEELKDEVEQNGGDVLTFGLDITDYEGIGEAIDSILARWGRIDILVNNAGTGYHKSLEEITKEEIDTVLDTNLKGLIYATKIVAAKMKSTGGGHIINISSIGGIVAGGREGVYSASKFGVNAFSEAMSRHLIKDNIKVTSICPGGIDTTWWDRNTYPPGKENLIETEEINSNVESIISSSKNTLYKQIVLIPTCEAVVR